MVLREHYQEICCWKVTERFRAKGKLREVVLEGEVQSQGWGAYPYSSAQHHHFCPNYRMYGACHKSE